MQDPITNKGTGFPYSERDRLRIRGLLPPRVLSLEAQATKVWHAIQKQPNSLEKNMYLSSLQDRNENLYFRVLIDHLSDLAPIVYTPTVREKGEGKGATRLRVQTPSCSPTHPPPTGWGGLQALWLLLPAPPRHVLFRRGPGAVQH